MSEIDKAVKLIGYKIAEQVKQAINSEVKHKDAGGQESALSGSVKVVLINTNDSVGFSITADKYWDYFNSGVDGTEDKKARTNKLGGKYGFKKKSINTEWVKDKVTLKKISGKLTKAQRAAGYEKQLKAARFLIGRSIAKHGLEPHPFLDKVMTDSNKKEWRDILSKAAKQEMSLIFK